MAHIVNQLTIIGGKQFVVIFVIVLVLRLDFVSTIATGKTNDTDLNKGEFKRSFADYSESREPFDGRRAAEDKISFYQQSSEQSKEKSRTFFKGDRDHLASGTGHTVRGYGYYTPPEDPGYGYQVSEQSYGGGSAAPDQNDDRDTGNYHYQQQYHGYQGNDDKKHGYDNRDYVYQHGEPQVYEHKGPVYHGYAGPPQHGHDHGVLALKGILLPLAGVALLGAAAALVSNPVLLQLGVISGKRRRRRSIKDIFKANQTVEQAFENKPAMLGNVLLDQGRSGQGMFDHLHPTGKNIKKRDGPLQAKGDTGRPVRHLGDYGSIIQDKNSIDGIRGPALRGDGSIHFKINKN